MTEEDLGYLHGAVTALPTPFRDGVLDLQGLDALVQHQARQRTSAIVVGGATGEGWSLEVDEIGQLVARAVAGAAERSDYRLRVLFGVSEASTERAATGARNAAVAGADALLIRRPSSRSPGDDRAPAPDPGRAAERAPHRDAQRAGRTGTDLTPEALASIVDAVPSVVAHCEAVGRPAAGPGRGALRSPPRRGRPPDRSDGPGGAVGAVTVVGNLVPGELARSSRPPARTPGDGLEQKLAPLVDALRLCTNPVPLKGPRGPGRDPAGRPRRCSPSTPGGGPP